MLRSVKFSVPVISIGNLSAGGTGKTPHVEYIIRLLGAKSDLAILSRGYGRNTKGFLEASESENAGTLGDEPKQFSTKFPDVRVCVDEKRVRGARKILEKYPDTKAIILDDAFQHRYIKAGLSIMLTDYHKLYTSNYILPYGTLRESRSGAKRADIIIVTKTPNVLSPIERKSITAAINRSFKKRVMFSYIRYGNIISLWDNNIVIEPGNKHRVIMLVSGIANSYPLEFELKSRCDELVVVRFKDHHKYTEADLETIKRNYSDIYSRNKLLVTTEKDAMRMQDPSIREIASKLPFYYIPIEIELHKEDKRAFDEIILNYVREN